MMQRKIIHIDMDAFYASIEQRDNPTLKGKPVIVGGSPEQRGVVAAASYEARKFGIHSAMPTKRAMALCGNLVLLYPDFAKYVSVSKHLYNIYKEYTDLIEPVSLDEAYLDVTENKKDIATATEIAVLLKKRIKDELALTASAGVAPNKLLAKIASDEKKPDGLFVVKPHHVEHFVKDLEVRKIWGVGKVTQEKLHAMGVATCGDLQRFSKDELAHTFGKFGNSLFFFARGIDERPVESRRIIKSVGAEITFPEDYLNMEFIKNALFDQTKRVCDRLNRKDIKGKTIVVKLKYSDFIQITRNCTIDHFTDNLDEIYSAAEKLLEKTEAGMRKVRLVGVSVGNFGTEATASEDMLF